MTIAFSEIQDKDRFIIRSGNGFFVKFVGNTPQMISTPILASVFNYYEAVGVMLEFERLGFQAELIMEPGG